MRLTENIAVMLLLPILFILSGFNAVAEIGDSIKQQEKITDAVQPKSMGGQQFVPSLVHWNTKWRQVPPNILRRLVAAKLNYLKEKRQAEWKTRVNRHVYDENNHQNSDYESISSKTATVTPVEFFYSGPEWDGGEYRKNVIVVNEVDQDYYHDILNFLGEGTKKNDEEYREHQIMDEINELFPADESLYKSNLKELDNANNSESNGPKIMQSELEVSTEQNHTSKVPCKVLGNGGCDSSLSDDNKRHKEGNDGDSHSHDKAHSHTQHLHGYYHTGVTHNSEEHGEEEKENKAQEYSKHHKQVVHPHSDDGLIHVLKNRPYEYLKHRQTLMSHCLQHFSPAKVRPQHGPMRTGHTGNPEGDESHLKKEGERMRAATRFCQNRVHQLMTKHHSTHGHIVHRHQTLMGPSRVLGDRSPSFLAVIPTEIHSSRGNNENAFGKISVKNTTEDTISTISPHSSSTIPNETATRKLDNFFARFKRLLQHVA